MIEPISNRNAGLLVMGGIDWSQMNNGLVAKSVRLTIDGLSDAPTIKTTIGYNNTADRVSFRENLEIGIGGLIDTIA